MLRRLGEILLVGSIIVAVITACFWPWSTEGVVRNIDYQRWTDSAYITFDDGRTIKLTGQPPKSILQGKYYKITYNSFKYFYNVEEVEK